MAVIKNDRVRRYLGFKNALNSHDIIECVFLQVGYNHYIASGFSNVSGGCTLLKDGKDGMGLVPDNVVNYDAPIATGLEHCFDPFSKKEHSCHFTTSIVPS